MWTRCWSWIGLCGLLLLTYSSGVHASASLYYTQWHPYSASRESSYTDRLIRSRRSKTFPGTYSQGSSAVLLAARKERVKTEVATSEPEVLKEPQEVSFDDLGPVGKVVASTTELMVAIVINYVQGYLTGWLAGTFIGIPGLLFRPLEPAGVPQMFMTEFKGRLSRMNTRSVRFGKNFGGVSAIFKGSDVAIRRLRYGKNDEWNDVLGSALSGAIFARKEGPLGMAKGAILWGGMIYILNGASTSPLSRYKEERVEF